jgi:hypothetical protein
MLPQEQEHHTGASGGIFGSRMFGTLSPIDHEQVLRTYTRVVKSFIAVYSMGRQLQLTWNLLPSAGIVEVKAMRIKVSY